MEIEPQIGFWRSFDEPSRDEYISWQEDSTAASNTFQDTEKKPTELSNPPSIPTTPQRVDLEPKQLETNSSKASSCPVSSTPIQRRSDASPSKEETVKTHEVAPRSSQIKYAITNSSSEPKLVIKLVPKQPRAQTVASSKTLCLICERTFFDQRSLNAHLTRMHAPTRNLRNKTANGYQSKYSSGGRRSGKTKNDDGDNRGCCWVLQCGLCKMTFLKARDLHQHTIAMHGSARIVIKTPWTQDPTTEEQEEEAARNSGSIVPTSQPQMMTSEKTLTQTLSVDTAESSESAIEKILEEDEAEQKYSTVKDDRAISLPSSDAGRTKIAGAEARPVQPSKYAGGQKTPVSGISCFIPDTPVKVSQGIASFDTTDSISSIIWQDEDGPQDLTSGSNLESEHHTGGSSERSGSQMSVPYNEVSTNPAACGSTSSGIYSLRETSVCTVAPTAKDYTSPIVSTLFASCLPSAAARLEFPPVSRNSDEGRSAIAPVSTNSLIQRSPPSHPNLKRPLSNVLADCQYCSGGDISSEMCAQQPLRSPASLTPPTCTTEIQDCALSLARLVSGAPITTAIPNGIPRPCETCMNLRRYKSENQVETTAKMLLGKTYELLTEINKRPLDMVKPLVNALQRLIFTMDANVFVAYMNCVLPEASRTAVGNPYLKRMLSQPPMSNSKSQDAPRTTTKEQSSNMFYAGFQEVTGPGKNCDEFRCPCSVKHFKGTPSSIPDYNPIDFGKSFLPSGSHPATANPHSWEPAKSFHNGL